MADISFLLTLASVGASSARSLLSKKISDAGTSVRGFGRVNLILSLCALAIVLIYACGAGFAISVPTLLLAALYAVFTMSAQLCYMRALGIGDASVVTFIYSCGFVIPSMAGTLLWREPVTSSRVIGVITLLTAFFLCSGKKSETRTRGAMGWAFLAMASSGAVGLIQKLHGTLTSGASGGFLVTAFALMCILSLGCASIGKPLPGGFRTPMLPTVVCGICIGAANIINLYLAGTLPAILFFPSVNGGVTVTTALLSILLYDERPTPARISGLMLGLLSIFLIAW